MPWEFKIAITAFVVLIGCYVLDRQWVEDRSDIRATIVAYVGAASFFAIPVSLLVALWRLA